MFYQKTLALILSWIMMFVSCESLVSAQVNPNKQSVINNDLKQIKALFLYEKPMLQYMDKNAKNILLRINQDSQKEYYQNYLALRTDITDYFKTIQKYPEWYTSSEVKASLKTKANAFTAWQQETEKVINTNQNPFAIKPDEIATVESDITSIQKDLISVARSYIDELSTLDVKKTANGTYRVEFGGDQWAELTIAQSFSISSFLQNRSEFDITAQSAINIKQDVSSWNSTEKLAITGDIQIDGNAKLINNGEDLYITIRSGSLNLSGSLLDASGALESTGSTLANNAKKIFDNELALTNETLSKFIGKTIHVSLLKNQSTFSDLKPSDILKNITAVMTILENNSLLTPFKKLNNTYSLIAKKDTIQKIYDVFEQKPSDEDFNASVKSMKQMPLLYTNAGNGNSELFFNIQESEVTGRISLARNAGLYTFSEHIKSTSKNDPFGLDLTIQRDSVVGSFSAPNKQITATTNWINNQLDIKAQFADNTLIIAGPLSKDTTGLSFQYNKKEFANYQQKRTNNTYDYTLSVTINLKDLDPSIESSPFTFTAKGSTTLESGNFPIVKPTDAVEFESLNINQSSSGGN